MPVSAIAFATAVSWLTFLISLSLLSTTFGGTIISYEMGGWAPPIGIEYRVDDGSWNEFDEWFDADTTSVSIRPWLDVRMPSFFGFMLWSTVCLIPLFLLMTLFEEWPLATTIGPERRPDRLVGHLRTALAVGSAFTIVHLVFGQVHLLTLVFGSSLIGSVIDYSIHFLADRFRIRDPL